MGTPQPPNPPGDECALCWGPGGALGDLPTPRYATMTLHNMLPGDNYTPELEQLLLTPHLLEQTFDPCRWEVRDGQFVWQWILTPNRSECQVFSGPPHRQFFNGDIAEECITVLTNLALAPADNVLYSGFAAVFFEKGD